MRKRTNTELIHQNTGCVEWYTPEWIMSEIRSILGTIDLDPASCELANETVGADKFFTVHEDGLNQNWYGNVWMNHPYSRQSNKKWIQKLIDEYKSGRVKNAICITFASTGAEWYRPLFSGVQCYLYKRVKFIDLNGKTGDKPAKYSVLTFFGDEYREQLFADVFAEYGGIQAAYKKARRKDEEVLDF